MKPKDIQNKRYTRYFFGIQISSITLLIYIFLIGWLLSGTSTASDDIEKIPPSKVIRFVGDANWTPYHFLNESNEPDGFSIDLVNALCKELNLRCEITLYQNWA